MDLFEEIVELIPRLPRDPDQAYPFAGAEEWKLRAFEARTGLQLPPALRRWLKFINGAAIGPGVVYGLGSRRHSYGPADIGEILDRRPSWIERGWIPVGSDGFGNYYVLATRPEDGPGTPVLFVEPINDPDIPSYVVASDLFRFLRFYFRKDLGEQGWPCDPDKVLPDDPALSAYSRHPKCWENQT